MSDMWRAAASLLDSLGLRGCRTVADARLADWTDGGRHLDRLSAGVRNALERPGPLATNFRMIDSNREIDPSKWRSSRVGDGEILQTVLKAPQVTGAVRSGATMAIGHLEALDGDIMRFSEALEYLLGTRVWVNCYIASNGDSAFGAHADAHHVLIVQLAGEKRWVVSRPDGADLSVPLTSGECLAIPAGTVHEVTGTGELSVHLTVSFLPFGGARQLAMCPDRRSGVSFPAALTGLRGTERGIRWASRFPPVVEVTESEVRVTSLGKKLRFGRAARATLCALSEGREYSWAELAELGELTTDQLTALLDFCLGHDLVICEG